MFQASAVKVFLLLLLAASLGVFWYLDTKFYHWDHNILPEPDTLVVENVPKNTVNDTFKPKVFIPTKEWQTIEEGQPIPPGLHIKIDLHTGEKKAKLMDDNEIDEPSSLAILQSNISEHHKQSKNLPEKVHKFKSYDETKDDLGKLNLNVKSEIQIMEELSTKFQNQMKIYEEAHKNLENILTDLEYLLHQVDTAESFIQNDGINAIIISCINSSSSFLKSQGALLLGSAASNNQKVQISAIKSNVIPLLLKHISDEYDFKVQKECFYALSSIIRQFPAAQKQVIDQDGIQIFMSVLKRPETDFNTKLKLKVSNLLEDLVVEIEDAKLTLYEEIDDRRRSEAKDRVHQYEELHLKDKLVENGWCGILANEFMTLSSIPPTNEESHDMVEASGKSLLAMSNLCKFKPQENKQLYDSLYKLEIHYKKLANQDKTLNPIYKLMNELTNTYDPVLEKY